MSDTEAIKYIEDQIQKCIDHFNGSYNPPTRYKWMERQNMFEEILAALRGYKSIQDELSVYRQMEMRCKEKYGCSIAKQLNL